MKPAILVISHPNTPEKEYILKDFGNFISQYKIPHYLVTNYPAEKDTQKEFTGCYYTSNNPKGQFGGFIWKTFGENQTKHIKHIPNWCYSESLLRLEAFKFLKSLGYTHIISFIYDITPNYNQIKDFINYSFEQFTYGKKGVFVKYNKFTNEDSLSTIQCASEVDFFIDNFDKGISNYNKPERSLCEDYWYDIFDLLPDVNILPRDKALDGIYSSSPPDKINNINYWIGYFSVTNKIYLYFQNQFLDNFYLTDKNNNTINYNEQVLNNTLKIIEFDSILNKEYYISYNTLQGNKTEFLFKNSEEWRKINYFEKI
jgi:hypothetical protein